MAKITTLFIADRPKNIESNYGKEFLQNVLDNVTCAICFKWVFDCADC